MNGTEARALLERIRIEEPTISAELVWYGGSSFGIHVWHRKARIDRRITSPEAWQAFRQANDDQPLTALEAS